MTVDTGAMSVTDRITHAVKEGVVQLPPLPELAIKLQELLADEDSVDAKRVAELVQNEPAVVASLLRVANSAAFGGLREVTELNQAIARLGLKQVGSIVTALLMKGHFVNESKEKKQMLQGLWDHSVSTGFCARRLADNVGRDPEEAFLAGLLHDCGRLLVLKAVDHLESEGLDVEITQPVLLELMESLHTELGHHTVTEWKLPEPIGLVTLHHEQDFEEGSDAMLTCVQAANLITKKLGFHIEPDEDVSLLDEPAIDALGLGDVEVAALMVDLEDELEEVRGLF